MSNKWQFSAVFWVYLLRIAEILHFVNIKRASCKDLLQVQPSGNPGQFSSQAFLDSSPVCYGRLGCDDTVIFCLPLTIEATSNAQDLSRHATELDHAVWLPGYRYFKAGVILSDLRPAGCQGLIFAFRNSKSAKAAMAALDAVNARFGSGIIQSSSTELKRNWSPRQHLLSA